jgi:serine/threonine protein kinase
MRTDRSPIRRRGSVRPVRRAKYSSAKKYGRVASARLKREVAIKTLPVEFSRDRETVARFQREAEVLASLNHPNIAAIYDCQESDGRPFLIMELVPGETLTERIARGPLSLEDSPNAMECYVSFPEI